MCKQYLFLFFVLGFFSCNSIKNTNNVSYKVKKVECIIIIEFETDLLIRDSLGFRYFFKKAYINSEGVNYSIIYKNNLLAIKNDCQIINKKFDKLLTIVPYSETLFPFSDKLEYVGPTTDAIVFKGNIYSNQDSIKKKYLAFNFFGKAVFIENTCKKYEQNYFINNDLQDYVYAKSNLSLPQVSLISLNKILQISKKEMQRNSFLNKTDSIICISGLYK